jgi:hypothetical protein
MGLKDFFRQSVRGLSAAWKQYPLLGIASILGYIVYNYIEATVPQVGGAYIWAKAILYAIWLSLPLIFVLGLTTKQGGRWQWIVAAVTLLGMVAVGGTTVMITDEGVLKNYIFVSYGLLAVGISIMSPLLLGGGSHDLWKHSQQLAIHFVLAALFTSLGALLLILGLSALKYLFGLTQIGIREEDIAVFSFTVGHTFIFLALWGKKDDESEDALSRFLKILGYYVLTPVSILYTIILYAYVIRLGIIREIPEGWISNLVLGLAAVVAGLWSILYPDIVQEKDHKVTYIERLRYAWLSKWVFLAFIPLSILQLSSVGYRIYMWGWTIPRYGAFWMGALILFACVYMVATRNKKLHHIAWIALITFIIGAYSPLNAYLVSLHSIQNKLSTQIDLFSNTASSDHNHSKETQDEKALRLSDDFFYLYHSFGSKHVQTILDQKCPEALTVKDQNVNREINYGSLQVLLSKCLDYDFLNLNHDLSQGQKYFYLAAQEQDLHQMTIDVSPFQTMRWAAIYNTDNKKQFILSNDGSNLLKKNVDSAENCAINLSKWISQLSQDVYNLYELSAEEQTIEQTCDNKRILFLIQRVEGYITIKDTVVTRIEGIWLE